MPSYQVSKTNDRRSWEVSKQREGVSASVWEVQPGLIFDTATDARRYCEKALGATPGRWQRNMGRGSAFYRTFVKGSK